MVSYRSKSCQQIWLYLLFLLLPAGFNCGGPIPDGFGIRQAPGFFGSPAVPNPLPPKDVAPHPLLSPVSGIHSDAANAFGGIAIGPDGTVCQGVAGGILALRDGS